LCKETGLLSCTKKILNEIVIMSSHIGSHSARRGGRAQRFNHEPSQSPIRPDRSHSRKFNKSLDKITHVLESITTRSDKLEQRRFSTRSSTPMGRRSRNSKRQSLDDTTRRVYDFVRLQHHATNWESCPTAISKPITKVVENIHPTTQHG